MDTRQGKSELALLKTDVVDVVTDRIRKFRDSGEIHFPSKYSPENALKSAWLLLQDIKDKDNNPALLACTKDSIANALLDMVVQGLNPAKKQGYFIVYGKNLTFQRSYFGTIHVIKTVDQTVQDVFADVVYEDDEFEYEKQRGKTVITKHKQKLGNVDKQKIIAAYGSIIYKDNREESLIMTIEEIKQAWRQSPTRPLDDNGCIKPNSVHGKFTQEMCKKTVINRLCKIKINASDDNCLIMDRIKTSNGDNKTMEVENEINQNANKEPLDIDIDIETGEILEADYKELDDDLLDIPDEDIQAMLNAEADMMACGMGMDF